MENTNCEEKAEQATLFELLSTDKRIESYNLALEDLNVFYF